MTKQEAKDGSMRLIQLITDIRVILTTIGLIAGGAGVKVFGDAGVTAAESRAIADSVARAHIEPVNKEVNALISILTEAFPEVKKAANEYAIKNKENREIRDALSGER